MSMADLRRSASTVLNVALVAIWFLALSAVGAIIVGLSLEGCWCRPQAALRHCCLPPASEKT